MNRWSQYPQNHTQNGGPLQRPHRSDNYARQEDDQPNLRETGAHLRPASYVIGRREPEPVPPHIATASSRGGYAGNNAAASRAARGEKYPQEAGHSLNSRPTRHGPDVPQGPRGRGRGYGNEYRPGHDKRFVSDNARNEVRPAPYANRYPSKYTGPRQNGTNRSWERERSCVHSNAHTSDLATPSNYRLGSCTPVTAVHANTSKNVSKFKEPQVSTQSNPSPLELLASVQPLVERDIPLRNNSTPTSNPDGQVVSQSSLPVSGIKTAALPSKPSFLSTHIWHPWPLPTIPPSSQTSANIDVSLRSQSNGRPLSDQAKGTNESESLHKLHQPAQPTGYFRTMPTTSQSIGSRSATVPTLGDQQSAIPSVPQNLLFRPQTISPEEQKQPTSAHDVRPKLPSLESSAKEGNVPIIMESEAEQSRTIEAKGKQRASELDVISISSSDEGETKESVVNVVRGDCENGRDALPLFGHKSDDTMAEEVGSTRKPHGRDQGPYDPKQDVRDPTARLSEAHWNSLTDAEKKGHAREARLLRKKEKMVTHHPGDEAMALPKSGNQIARLGSAHAHISTGTPEASSAALHSSFAAISVQQTTSSIFTAIVELPTPVIIHKLAFLAHLQYNKLEIKYGRPVYLVGEVEISGQKNFRFMYECPLLASNQISVVLPRKCRLTHPDAKERERRRDLYRQDIIRTLTTESKIVKEATFSTALLLITLETLPAQAEALTMSAATNCKRPESVLPKSSVRHSESVNSSSDVTNQVKRERSSPPAPVACTPDPPPCSSNMEHLPPFPYNIKTSYADTPHTQSYVEMFLNSYLERYESSRHTLIDFYTESASFGYAASAGNTLPSLRNRTKQDACYAYGQYGIVNALRKIPACTHKREDGKYIYDAIRLNCEGKSPLAFCDLFLTIHGELVEFESKRKRSFDRTFYLVPINNPAGLPYTIQSDTVIVRSWTDPKAWRPNSLPLQVPSISKAVLPLAKPTAPLESIILPTPQISSKAFCQAVNSQSIHQSNLDAAPKTPSTPLIAGQGSRPESNSSVAHPAKRSQEDADLADDNEANTKHARGRLEKQRMPEADNEELRALKERVKSLERLLKPEKQTSKRRLSEIANVEGDKQDVPEATSTSSDKPSKKKKKKSNSISSLGNESGPGPEIALPSSHAGKVRAPPSLEVQGTLSYPHQMHGTRNKARSFFQSEQCRGYLAVNIRGDVHFWSSSNKEPKVFEVARQPDGDEGLSVNSAAWSESHNLLMIGYTEWTPAGPDTTNHQNQKVNHQISLIHASDRILKPIRNGSKRLPYEILPHKPHSRLGVTAVGLLSHAGRESFVTAGNDKCIQVWNIKNHEGGAFATSDPKRVETKHSSAVRSLTSMPLIGHRLISAGADRRVCLIDMGGDGRIVNDWKEAMAVNQVYPHREKANLALVCLASNNEQFRLIDVRKKIEKPAAVFGAPTQKDAALGMFLHGDLKENLFSFAFDDAVRFWDLRNTSKPYQTTAGASGVIQPHFESNSTKMTFLEKKHFTVFNYQYKQS